MRIRQLNLRANLRGKGSYSVVAREMAVALWRLGLDVVADPMLAGHSFTVDVGSARREIIDSIVSRPHRPAREQVHVRSLSRPNEREVAALAPGREHSRLLVPDSVNVCLFAIDGTAPDPYAQYDPEQGWDLLGLPSTHSMRALLSTGVDPHRLAVIPQGVDTRIFNPSATPLELSVRGSVRFLLNSTPWLDRKNIEGAFRAYFETFTKADDVALVVHCLVKESKEVRPDGTVTRIPIHQRVEHIGRIVQAETGSDAEVVYLLEDLDLAEVAGLNAACHCLIHPHRAEAFCLTIAEAMASGLATIVTPWGGNADYCSPETNLLVPFTLVEEHRVSELSWAEPEPSPIVWAQPSTAGIARWLRAVHQDPDSARALGLSAAEHMRRFYSWERACDALLSVLRHRFDIEIDIRR